MRPVLTVLCLALLTFAPRARAADDATPAFPATAPGRHAQAWFAAYAADEAALRAFWTEHGSPASLAQRPVEMRLQVARQMHESQGALTALRVSSSGEDFCAVLARSEKSGTVLIRFLCDAGAPHGLVAIRIEEPDDDAAPGAPGAGQQAPGTSGTVGGPRAGGAAPTPAPETGPPPTDAEIVAALGSGLDTLARADEFAGVALLEKDGTTLLARAVGQSSRTARTPNALETRFNLGSLNKIITHVAIGQLAQAGKLGLDDPVTRWLPDYRVVNAEHITLRMLLAHRGGVPDVLTNPELGKAPGSVRTAADWYALVREMPLNFEPGTRQRYSNGGFVLLGQVIAAASGQDYYDYVREHIYVPAGMTRTAHLGTDELTADVAIGYAREGDTRVANTKQLPGRGSAAGGGYSTAGDLVRFADALRAGRLLDAAHVRDVFGEHFSLSIAGGSPGVNGMLAVAGPYTLVVLANVDPPAAEQFGRTVGGMLRRAAAAAAP